LRVFLAKVGYLTLRVAGAAVQQLGDELVTLATQTTHSRCHDPIMNRE